MIHFRHLKPTLWLTFATTYIHVYTNALLTSSVIDCNGCHACAYNPYGAPSRWLPAGKGLVLSTYPGQGPMSYAQLLCADSPGRSGRRIRPHQCARKANVDDQRKSREKATTMATSRSTNHDLAKFHVLPGAAPVDVLC